MCGRFNLEKKSEVDQLLDELGVTFDYRSQYNIAPTETIPIILENKEILVLDSTSEFFLLLRVMARKGCKEFVQGKLLPEKSYQSITDGLISIFQAIRLLFLIGSVLYAKIALHILQYTSSLNE